MSRAGKPLSDEATANSARVFQSRGEAEVSHLGHNGPVRSVALTPDGRYVATASEDKTARVFDAETGNEIARLTHQAGVNAVAFSPDGHWVATGSDDRTARVFEAASGTEVARVAHQGAVEAVAFSPDSRRIVTGSADKSARVLEASGGSELWRVAHPEPVTSAAFTADGQRVLVGRGHVEAATVQLFETLTGKQLLDLSPDEPEVRSVAVSEDGRFLVVGGGMLSPTRVFRADDSAKPLLSINAPSPVEALGISPDGRRVATLAGDHTARIWEGTTQIAEMQDPFMHTFALSADGRRMVVGGGSLDAGTVRVLDLPARENPREPRGSRAAPPASWKEVARFTPREPVFSVAISEDGRWVAAAGKFQGKTAQIYEVEGSTTWSRPAGSVGAIALNARAGLAATGDEDGTARVLELATGKETLPRLGVGGPVVNLRIVDQGRYLLVASRHPALGQRYDIVVMRQPLVWKDLIDDACSRVTRNLTPEEWTRYVGPETPYRKTCPARP